MSLYQKVEDYVKEIFTKAGKEKSIKHFLRTVYWIKKLKPDADEGLLIAGVSHDISRPFRDDVARNNSVKDKGFFDSDYLKIHQKESSRIIGEFLEKEGVSSKLIQKVKELVSHHEVGGNDDQNLVMDADSISFFENNAKPWVNSNVKKFGKDKVKEKFDWMFNRISSEERKNICKPMYDKAIEMLESS